MEDFSTDHLLDAEDYYESSNVSDNFPEFEESDGNMVYWTPIDILDQTIDTLNFYRKKYLKTKDKKYWWQMIQLLPSSYNQRRTLCLNYEVLANIYRQRKGHRLDEWQTFREWIESLPYSELITLKEKG